VAFALAQESEIGFGRCLSGGCGSGGVECGEVALPCSFGEAGD